MTTKVHLAADPRCRPLSFLLTEGQAADSPRFIPVLDKIKVRGPVGRPRTRPDAVAGDKAERLINKLKAWRGIATRYDKTPQSYLAGLHLRGAVIWMRSLQ